MERREVIKILGITLIAQPLVWISCNPFEESPLQLREDYLVLLFSQFKFQEILSVKNSNLLQKMYLEYLSENLAGEIALAGLTPFIMVENKSAAGKIVDQCQKLANRKTPYFDLRNPSSYPHVTRSVLGIGGIGAGIALTGNPYAAFVVGSMGIIATSMFDSSLQTKNTNEYLKDDNSINSCVFYKLSELALTDPSFKKKVIKIDPNFGNPDAFVNQNLAQKPLSAEILDELSKNLSSDEFRDYVYNQFQVAIGEQNLILNEFVADYHEKYSQEQKVEQRQISIARINNICEDIESFGNVTAHILGTVFGFTNEAQHFQTFAKGTSLLINAASMFSIGAISPMSFANQMTNSISILGSLMGGGPPFEEQVFKSLENIQNQLSQIQDSLDRIEKMQFKIILRIEELIADVKSDFNRVNFKLDNIRLRLFANYELQMQIDRDNTRNDFGENIVLLKTLFKTGLMDRTITGEGIEYVYRKLYYHAKFLSRNVSFTGNINAAAKLELLADEFRNNGYLDLSIALVLPLLSASNIHHKYRGSQLCNPYEWIAGSCAMIEGLYMTKSFDSHTILEYLIELKEEGENINSFINETVNEEVLNQCIVALKANIEDLDENTATYDAILGYPIFEFASGTFGFLFKSWIDEFHSLNGYNRYGISQIHQYNVQYENLSRIVYESPTRRGYFVEVQNDPLERCIKLELLRPELLNIPLDIGKVYRLVTQDGKDFMSEFGIIHEKQVANSMNAKIIIRAISTDAEVFGQYRPTKWGVVLSNPSLLLEKCRNLLADNYILCTKTKLNDFLVDKLVSDPNNISLIRKFEIQNLACKVICGYSIWKNSSNELLPLQYQLRNNIYSFEGRIDEKSKTQHLNNISSLDSVEDVFKLLENGMSDYLWTNSGDLIKNRMIIEFRNIFLQNLEIYKKYLPAINDNDGLPIVNSTIKKIETAINFLKLS